MASRSDPFRVLIVSDSHLSARAPEAVSNWHAAAAVAADVGLVIHAGDLTLDGVANGADTDGARRLLDSLPVPWVAVPGNHDIGDNPGAAEGLDVDQVRLDRWRATVGPDYWAVDLGEWTAVGVDAQLFGSGLPAEAEQWRWLEDRLTSQPAERSVALVSHKPLTASDGELAVSPAYRFVPESARQRIISLLNGVRCPLVVSGHVHQYRILESRDRQHVWAPTTWAVLPERVQRTVGIKRCGAVALTLGTEGFVSVEFVVPPGMTQFTLGEDLPDPYHP